MLTVERLEQLIKKGQQVLNTKDSQSSFLFDTDQYVNSQEFKLWKLQVIQYLQDNLSNDNQYLISFSNDLRSHSKKSVMAGIKILESLLEDANLGLLKQPKAEQTIDPIALLYKLFDRFHLVARQLRSRHGNRDTIDIKDEYDVQDVLHTLLLLDFDDIRAEEWTPSHAGSSSRMDFLLRDFKIVIEVKKTRSSLTVKELGEQLIVDIERYQSHPNCEILLCFVYDPDGYVRNPRGIENDLSREEGDLKVRVYIRP
ncbi:hypothetical protein ACAW74_25980 [Fibrella sp. WM1]|uniref:PD-(D/E)XK nuclease domain-containing protein n=1 Tax=Fibrella musci TaxID=3242485 RepID=UPI003521EF42